MVQQRIRIQLPDSAIHGQAPLELLRSKLPIIPKLLFAVLWTYGFRDREEPEISQLAAECSCSVSGIRRGIRILEWTGWIRTHLSTGRSHPNIYYPLDRPDIALGHRQFSEYELRKQAALLCRKATPRDHKATPRDHKGTPRDHKGTPRDHKGTPREWEGLKVLEERVRVEIQAKRTADAAPPSPAGFASTIQGQKPAETVHQDATRRPRAPLALPAAVRRGTTGAPLSWEAWGRYLALTRGRLWTWSRQQVAAANQLTRLVPPGALHGLQRNVAADEYLREKRGLDLRRVLDDINKFLPTIPRPMRQTVLAAAAPGPAETEADRLKRAEDEAAYERFLTRRFLPTSSRPMQQGEEVRA
jgi:hypothetical protein